MREMSVQSQVCNKNKPRTGKWWENYLTLKPTLTMTDVFGISFIELSHRCALLTFLSTGLADYRVTIVVVLA